MTNQADEPVTEDNPNAPGRADSAAVTTRRRSDDDVGDRPDRSVDRDAADGCDTEADGDSAAPSDHVAGESGPLMAGGADDSTTGAAEATGGTPDSRLADRGGVDEDRDGADAPGAPEANDTPAARTDETPEFEETPRATMARIPPAPTAAAPARRDEADREQEFADSDADAAPGAGPDDVADDDEPDSATGDFVVSRRGRGGYDPEADAIARATRYRFRQRTALGLVLSTLLFAGFAIVMSPLLWWACALSVLGLGAYLAYLRRQVRHEEDIRRRRASRIPGAGKRRAGDADAVVR
ncbi:MAG: hypothetical protein ACRD0P_39265, partial [Stackebrandtia sp.]